MLLLIIHCLSPKDVKSISMKTSSKADNENMMTVAEERGTISLRPG